MSNNNDQKEHDLFLKIMEVGHIPMFFLSLELLIDKVSPYISILFNIPHQKIINQYYPDFCKNYHLTDLVSPHLSTLKIYPEKIIEQAEIIHIEKDNKSNSRHIHWQLFSVLRKGNEPIGYALLGKDVTTIQEQQMYLENVISCLPGSIYWKDRQGVYLGCNEVVVRMAGVNSSDDIIGKTDFDLCWSDTAEQVTKVEQEIMNSGVARELEITGTLSDGTLATFLTTKTPLRDYEGNVVGIIANSLDITQRKQMEIELKLAKEKAEKAQQAEDELKKTRYQLEGAKLISGSIAHEIRTPLATIKSWIQGIEKMFSKLIAVNQWARDKNLTIETITENEALNTKKAIQSISKKVDQSNVIINMLLTKLQNINFEFSEFTVCSARQCIENAINEFILPDNMDNKLSFNNDNDFKFMGNSTLVMHIVMNLLKNAIFYILKAEKGEITIWLEKHKEYNEIHFKDTGTGIAPQVLPHIFDSFYTTESSTGTGVGLAFSKMVMQAHQGKIECFSKEGEYTEFILSFPKLDKEPVEV